jgi:hypothetical protein
MGMHRSSCPLIKCKIKNLIRNSPKIPDSSSLNISKKFDLSVTSHNFPKNHIKTRQIKLFHFVKVSTEKKVLLVYEQKCLVP